MTGYFFKSEKLVATLINTNSILLKCYIQLSNIEAFYVFLTLSNYMPALLFKLLVTSTYI